MIDHYQFGKIIINGKSYSSDVIVFGDIVRDEWWRNQGHELCISDIKDAIDEFDPTVVVVGTGKFGMMKILPETESFLESRSIRLIAQKTGKAWKTFNSLANSEKVLGAFHLTC